MTKDKKGYIIKLDLNEVLKDIPNYEGVYAVTIYGNVWSYPKINGKNSHQKGRWLKQQTERTGYKFVVLQVNKKRKLHFVHGLVAKTYLGDLSKNKQINHKDGNKNNNEVSNLEWITCSENIKHSFMLGLSNQKGSHNAYAKLNETKVLEIRKRNSLGEKQNKLSKEYGVSCAVINRIIKNIIWTHC